MQLDQLEQLWRQLDQKLDRTLALQSELTRQVVMQPARRRMHRLAFWPALDVAFSVFLVAASVCFLSGHWQDWRLVLNALLMIGGAIALGINSVRQLAAIAQLDWSGPVAGIQTALTSLRATRICQFKWVILLAPLLGFAAFLTGIQWILEWVSQGRAHFLDRVLALSPAWIITNYVFGVLFVPVGFYLSRILAKRCQHQNWWQAVLDDLAGNSLLATRRELARWTELRGLS